MNKIKIVADNKIPYLKGVLEPYAQVVYLSPDEISNDTVKDADALIIRTRTKCNSDLLDNTNVKFIATATIGFDHIDIPYCETKGVKWVSAPGCNSGSVKQYIASALVTIAEKKKIDFSKTTLGIVGVGNVGSKIEKLAKSIGMNVLLCDPPRKRNEGNPKFIPLGELIKESDIISFHVPLNKTGEDRTYHIADEIFFNGLINGKIIINSSRGEVIETQALKEAVKNGIVSSLVLDVWESEPNIDLDLLNMTDIATPHIAGYSADGKANGTAMSVNALVEYFSLDIQKNWYPKEIINPNKSNIINLDCFEKTEQEIISEIIRYTYNIEEDDKRLRNSVNTFEAQRGSYPVRREFGYYSLNLENCTDTIKNKLQDIGFNVN